MPSLEILGFIGAALVVAAFVPQVIRVFKLRSAYEISLLFTTLALVGCSLWLIYGISFGLLPIILCNAIMLVLIVMLLYAKLKYGR